MRLIDYISRQPIQKPKVTNKYDEEFAVATITRTRDAISAIYMNSTPSSCQSKPINTINQAHSRRALSACQIHHPKLFLPLNTRTNQLLLSNTVNAAHIQANYSPLMSASNTSPQTSCLNTTSTGRVTFQSALIQEPIQRGHQKRANNTQSRTVERRSVREQSDSNFYKGIFDSASKQGRSTERGARLPSTRG